MYVNLFFPQAAETVVKDSDIRLGQAQDSASSMDGIITETIAETITETTLQIPLTVSGS